MHSNVVCCTIYIVQHYTTPVLVNRFDGCLYSESCRINQITHQINVEYAVLAVN